MSHTGNSAAFYKALFVNIASDRLDAAQLAGVRRHLVHGLLAAEIRNGNDSTDVANSSLQRALEAALAAYAFSPHLSLFYGELQPPTREELARQNDLQGRSIAFDRLAAVRPAAGYCDLSAIEHWEVFGHCRLNG